jgi:hypothetical protein
MHSKPVWGKAFCVLKEAHCLLCGGAHYVSGCSMRRSQMNLSSGWTLCEPTWRQQIWDIMCYDWAKKKCHYGILGHDHDQQQCKIPVWRWRDLTVWLKGPLEVVNSWVGPSFKATHQELKLLGQQWQETLVRRAKHHWGRSTPVKIDFVEDYTL